MFAHSKSLLNLIVATIGEPKIGCEVGVWKGATSFRLLERFKSLNLLMIDRYRQLSEEEGRSSKVTARASQEDMYSYLRNVLDHTMFACDRRILLVGTSLMGSRFVNDKSLDFVFIDAAHEYDSVMSDIQCWYPKVRSGGLVSGHDYGGRKNRSGAFGVNKAVDKFVSENNYDLTLSPAAVWGFIKR